MRRICLSICMVILSFLALGQEWKVDRVFLVPSGNGVGEVGPSIKTYKDAMASQKGNPDAPWGVYGMGINSHGDLLFLDNQNKKILIYNTKGQLIEEWRGIGGSQPRGYPFGTIIETSEYLAIIELFSIAVYDIPTKKLLQFININSFGKPYDNSYFVSLYGNTAFYWDTRFLWCIPDITDPKSGPTELKANHKLLKSQGIVQKNNAFYMPNGELLFKDFSVYQPIFLQNDENKGSAGEYIGDWNGISVWIENGMIPIIGPIGGKTQTRRIIDSQGSKNPTNIHFVLSPDGFLYFTVFSLKDGGTIVNRLDLHPFLDEKKKLEAKK